MMEYKKEVFKTPFVLWIYTTWNIDMIELEYFLNSAIIENYTIFFIIFRYQSDVTLRNEIFLKNSSTEETSHYFLSEYSLDS